MTIHSRFFQLFALSCGVSALTACGDLGPKKSSKHEITYNTEAVNHLRVESDSGDIEIYPAGGETASVVFVEKRAKFSLDLDSCDTDFHIDGDTAYVKMKAGSMGGGCDLTAKIALRPEADITIDSGSGDLQIKSMRAPIINAKLGSGDVMLNNSLGSIDLSTGSGDVKVDLNDGDGLVVMNSYTKVKTGSGDVNVNYGLVPDDGTLSVKTGSGDVKVKLPSATKFSLSSDRGSGELKNELAETSDAAFHMNLDTGSGDVKVQSNGL